MPCLARLAAIGVATTMVATPLAAAAVINGDDGNNVLRGTRGADVIQAAGGNDVAFKGQNAAPFAGL